MRERIVRNASNGIGSDFPLETKCGQMSTHAKGTSAFVWPGYAMIVRRVESPWCLRICLGQNDPTTPRISHDQGKMACESMVGRQKQRFDYEG